jgi:hypothetical protein
MTLRYDGNKCSLEDFCDTLKKTINVYTQKKWWRRTMINKISLFLNFIILYNEAVNCRHCSQMLCSAAGCLIKENWHSRSCHSICGPTYCTTLQKNVQPTWQRDQTTLFICLMNVMVFNEAQLSYRSIGDVILTELSSAFGFSLLPWNATSSPLIELRMSLSTPQTCWVLTRRVNNGLLS